MNYKSALLFSFTLISLPASAFLDNKPIDTYICDNCSLEKAKLIATREASVNSCDRWRNGSPAAYCENISKDIIVADHQTEIIYKFIVTTSINSRNTQEVSVAPFFLTSTEKALVQEYFNYYKDIKSAIDSEQNRLNSVVISPDESTKLFSISPYLMGSSDSDCSNHPTSYFKGGVSAERNTKNTLVQGIFNAMGDKSWSDFKYEALASGGGISISNNGGGLSVSYQYVEHELSITKIYGNLNYLVFDIATRGNIAVDGSRNLILDLRLNKSFSRIDGVSLATLFRDGDVDLSGTLMSNCWIEYLKEEGEDVTDNSGYVGGSGTFEDPYDSGSPWPDGSFGSGSFCVARQKVETCSTTKDGLQTCTKTTLSWSEPC